MTNVLYKCPQCGSRLFAAPGGTRMRCPRHDMPYEQQEEFQGKDFSFIDEKGITHHSNPDEVALATMSTSKAKEYLRNRYESITGKRPDLRWGPETLLEEIQKLLPQPAIDGLEPETVKEEA